MLAGPLNPPQAALSGVVLGSGALLLLAAAAKLGRTARRAAARGQDAGEDAGEGGAIRAALRIGPSRWRRVELIAGLVETATGAAVCLGYRPAVAGTAMAIQGTIFLSLLTYARLVKAPGGCACVRRPEHPGATVGRPAQARAGFLLAAGVTQAVGAPLTQRWWGSGSAVAERIAAAAIALGVLAALLEAEQPWRTPRCGRRILSPRRDAFAALARHGTFAAVSAAAGPFAGGHTHRRDGCADEFAFRATGRVVVFRVSRTGPGGAPAVQARVEAVLDPGPAA
ncbi:hypothetical protein KGA66_09190 [Actinocrinis puniceicyclus]|uniref:Uncharacterized protein n=1 Tax=Actinocrinis puniceicyclus TaxID=977794 RepID=A0A8J8BDX3_9ACTN|nr:hypothetical protein [Actinocrinis puniceicyclus]MBS2963219.1 hypothetical protein [Actinocrinis puniceicyclus]